MIDAKSFMEFFEKEFDVQFIDSLTGKKVLDIIAENEKKPVPYGHPAYKSDYDRFLEAEEGKNDLI
jgi:hypothetical protein